MRNPIQLFAVLRGAGKAGRHSVRGMAFPSTVAAISVVALTAGIVIGLAPSTGAKGHHHLGWEASDSAIAHGSTRGAVSGAPRSGDVGAVYSAKGKTPSGATSSPAPSPNPSPNPSASDSSGTPEVALAPGSGLSGGTGSGGTGGSGGPGSGGTGTGGTGTQNSGASLLDLPRVAWWGGPSYYTKFSKAAGAGWTSDSFFPIAVFFGKPAHASQLAAVGINTYMGAEHDGSPISSITDTGISVIAQSEWTEAELGNDTRVVGWHISDECDQGEGACWADGNDSARLALQQGYAEQARSHSDGRFVQANFGNGVLGTYWATHTMAQQVGTVDVSSVDKYAYTSPGVDASITNSPYWPAGANPDSSAAYGWLQDRMATYSSPAASKPNWVFVETAQPLLNEPGARTIQPQQIQGAVWNAIIHGAAGISYFQHTDAAGCGTYSILECSANLTSTIRQVDAEITSLAPVINTQGYQWNFGSGTDTSLKVKDGSAYVFAMAKNGTGSRTFTLPKGISGTTVTVVGENRTLPVVNGRFTDSFAAEYSHHVYKISMNG